MSRHTYGVILTCPRCLLGTFVVTATVVEDPGIRTFENGDPGYPGLVEVEYDDRFPESCYLCKREWSNDDLEDFIEQVTDWAPEEPDDEAEAERYSDQQQEKYANRLFYGG